MLLVCMGKTRFGGIIWGEVVMMHAQKFPILMYFLPTYHMSMNSVLLAPGTGVFYLRGTTNKRVPATIVGSSSKADCVAIQYERSGHCQLYVDCPRECLTFPFCTCRICFYTLHLFFIGHESRGPICISSKTASLAGVMGSCNHQYRRDEVFGVEETVVAC